MVVRSFDVQKDPFRPCEDDEEILGPEIPYLSAIKALMYLENCTRFDITFSVNLLARYSSAPSRRHWNDIKHIIRYLRVTIDMELFYQHGSSPQLVGYADAGYLSDSHKEIIAIHEKKCEIDVKQIRSSDNLANLFTKALPTITFKKIVQNIGMRKLEDLLSCTF